MKIGNQVNIPKPDDWNTLSFSKFARRLPFSSLNFVATTYKISDKGHYSFRISTVSG
jgi:hypothetical protein